MCQIFCQSLQLLFLIVFFLLYPCTRLVGFCLCMVLAIRSSIFFKTMKGPFHLGNNFEQTPGFLVGSCSHTGCPAINSLFLALWS